MKKKLLIFLLLWDLSAKDITSNDVYTFSVLIQDHIHFLLKYYDIKHNHDAIMKRDKILFTNFKPRNTWEKAYEVLVKINMLRKSYDLPRIEPVGVEAVGHLDPSMVFEMNQRILTELRIFEIHRDIEIPNFKLKTFNNKTPLDNYNAYIDISASFDELNKRSLTPNYVYSETMRIYDDITNILEHLNIEDSTLPDSIKEDAIPKDVMSISMEVLVLIASLQKSVGIQWVDFSEFDKEEIKPSDVFAITGLIIAELQPIKAYIGLEQSVTPAAVSFLNKQPKNVEQLMRWNFKRLKIIYTLNRKIL